MVAITDSRNIIQQEEMRYRAAVSENTMTRIGATANFISNRQYDSHSYHLNGPISLFPVAAGPDGVFVFLFDAEITGFSYYIGETGASGSIIVDVHRITSGGTDSGTIFSTRPEIASSAANGSLTTRREVDSTTLTNPTGHTLAVLSTTQVNAGDALRLDLDQTGSGFRNFQLSIQYRPR